MYLNQSKQCLINGAFKGYIDEIGYIINSDSIKATEFFRLLKHVQKLFYACLSQGDFVEGTVFTRKIVVEEIYHINMLIA